MKEFVYATWKPYLTAVKGDLSYDSTLTLGESRPWLTTPYQGWSIYFLNPNAKPSAASPNKNLGARLMVNWKLSLEESMMIKNEAVNKRMKGVRELGIV